MSNTLIIPLKLVDDVRESVRQLMGGAAEEMSEALVNVDHELYPEWFLEPRRQLEASWAVIDQLGWTAGEETEDVEIDLQRYGALLKEAAASHLDDIEYALKNADDNDRTRTERGDPPRKTEILQRLAAFREFAAVLDQAVPDTD